MQVKNKAAVNAPWLCYTQPLLCQSHWCIRTPMATLGIVGLLVYTYSVGLSLVARSDLQGDSQEPQIVERATVKGFTLSLCPDVT